jgi:PEP-CTERM motif
MKMLRHVSFAFLALTLVGAGVHAKAETLLFENTLSDSGSNNLFGLGQELTVNTTTELTGIAFDLSTNNPTSPDVKYMIWNSDNSQLLYTSGAVAIATSTTKSWVEIPVTYTLNAGSTYFIAAIADAKMSIGLTALTDVNVNDGFTVISNNGDYSTYSSPKHTGNGTRSIALQLFGTQIPSVTPSAVPEPGSIALVGTGLLGLAGAGRRRWRC